MRNNFAFYRKIINRSAIVIIICEHLSVLEILLLLSVNIKLATLSYGRLSLLPSIAHCLSTRDIFYSWVNFGLFQSENFSGFRDKSTLKQFFISSCSQKKIKKWSLKVLWRHKKEVQNPNGIKIIFGYCFLCYQFLLNDLYFFCFYSSAPC